MTKQAMPVKLLLDARTLNRVFFAGRGNGGAV